MEDAHEIHKEVVVCRKHAVNLLLRIDPFKLPEAACFCLVGEGVGKALLLLACEARSSNSAMEAILVFDEALDSLLLSRFSVWQAFASAESSFRDQGVRSC